MLSPSVRWWGPHWLWYLVSDFQACTMSKQSLSKDKTNGYGLFLTHTSVVILMYQVYHILDMAAMVM